MSKTIDILLIVLLHPTILMNWASEEKDKVKRVIKWFVFLADAMLLSSILMLYNSYAISLTVVEDSYAVKVLVNKNVITKTHI